jgi:hypothetical protein
VALEQGKGAGNAVRHFCRKTANCWGQNEKPAARRGAQNPLPGRRKRKAARRRPFKILGVVDGQAIGHATYASDANPDPINKK